MIESSVFTLPVQTVRTWPASSAIICQLNLQMGVLDPYKYKCTSPILLLFYQKRSHGQTRHDVSVHFMIISPCSGNLIYVQVVRFMFKAWSSSSPLISRDPGPSPSRRWTSQSRHGFPVHSLLLFVFALRLGHNHCFSSVGKTMETSP